MNSHSDIEPISLGAALRKHVPAIALLLLLASTSVASAMFLREFDEFESLTGLDITS